MKPADERNWLTWLVLDLQDPLADGPTIQASATRALLQQHVTLDQVRAGLACYRACHIGLLVMHLILHVAACILACDGSLHRLCCMCWCSLHCHAAQSGMAMQAGLKISGPGVL